MARALLVLLLLAPLAAHAGAVFDQLQAVRDNVDGVAGMVQPRSVLVSPDGRHVYVVAGGPTASSYAIFARDAGSGLLTFLATMSVQAGFSGEPAISPDGAHLFLPGAALMVHQRDALSGTLTFVEQQMDAGSGFTGARAVAVSPDGASVYALEGSAGASLAVFSRDAFSGALTLVETKRDGIGGVDGLATAANVAVSPDGAHVYTAGGGTVTVFQRAAGTGALTLVEVEPGLPASNVTVSPDGAWVYSCSASLAVSVFQRNATTGTLTLVEGSESTAGVPVAVSPDGAWVYTPTTLLLRDATSGHLTLGDSLVNAYGGIAYIGGARSVVTSPDGVQVYVAAPLDSAVAVLRPRATATCSATPVAPCRSPTPGKGVLLLKDKAGGNQDRLTWKWLRGAATGVEEFGDPTHSTNDYAVCVYDGSTRPQPVLAIVAPAGGLWRAFGTSGFKYRDVRAQPVHGLSIVDLHAGSAGQAKTVVVGKRSYLPMPTLPLTLPVTAQLQSAGGECWGAVYATPRLNETQQFRARPN